MNDKKIFVFGERDNPYAKPETAWIVEAVSLPLDQRCDGYHFPKDCFVVCTPHWDTCIRNVRRERWEEKSDYPGLPVTWVNVIDIANELDISWYPSAAFDANGKSLDHMIGLYTCWGCEFKKLREEVNRRYF